MQENQLTNYSKEGDDRISVTPLYIVLQRPPLNLQVSVEKKAKKSGTQYKSLGYGQSDGIISKRILMHKELLLAVRIYFPFTNSYGSFSQNSLSLPLSIIFFFFLF
jgi:hypothetical protein